jgi:WD40 repeat protein/DNA-binding SARP family transcriptional activator
MVRRISLAGRIAVQSEHTALDERALPGRQPRLTFAMLVAERHRAVERDELAENLWAGSRPSTWEPALRGIVSRVRAYLVAAGLGGKDLLRTEAGSYHLGPLTGTEIDLEVAATQVEMSESALRSGAVDEAADAAARARGVLTRPLLPGIEGPWVDDKRRELARLHLRALDVLAEARLVLGDTEHAALAAEVAIATDPFRETAHRTLIRAHARAGNRAAGLRAYERCRQLLADELGVDPSVELQGLHRDLLHEVGPTPPPPPRSPSPPPTRSPSHLPSGSRLRPPTGSPSRPAAGSGSTPTTPDPAFPPYLGLRTFEEEHAAWFFGRDADTARLLDRLERTRFLAVLGASGSGKSSLVRAGLVAALRAGALPGSDTWSLRVVRPGADPLDALADALPTLDTEPGGPLDGRAVLVVDQLEEVFTLCNEASRRRAFLDGLVAAATAAGSSTVVVVTLRADFYPRLAEHPQLADLASAHQFLVTPLDEVGLAEAVEGPARLAGLGLEPGLTETILRDVARRPGALPLLQHALLELWQHRRERTLTLAGYLVTGGVEGALAQRAETTYAGLAPDDRRVVRRVLLRLTAPGDGTQYTRRRVAMAELASGAEDQAAVDRVVTTLTAVRLLTSDAAAGERYVEVSHEALVRGWPRLRDWLDEDRTGLQIHRRLTIAAAEWDRLGRDDDGLYRGARLAEAAAWAERDPPASNRLERAFLAASRQRADAEAERDRDRRRRAEQLAAVAREQSVRLAREARTSTARELAAVAVAHLDVDPERSILLALEAVDVTRAADGHVVREAEEALHRAVKRSRLVRRIPGGSGLALAADGTWFVSGGEDGTATIRTFDGEALRELGGHHSAVRVTAISPDGRGVATGTADGTVRLWDLRSVAPARVLGTHDGAVTGVTFAPDAEHLATTSVDRTVRIWAVGPDAPSLVLTGHEDEVTDVTFSPDGTKVATGSDDFTARIWELSTGRSLVLRGHVWQVFAVAFSPDGRQLATASNDGTAKLWDTVAGTPLRTYPHRQVAICAVAFTPDGRRLVTGSSDGSAQVWDAETGRPHLTLAGHVGPIDALAVTPDSRYLLTTSADGTTRCWDISIAGGRDWLTTPSANLRYASLAFSPDSRCFAVPRDEDGLTIRDARTGAVIRTLTGHPAKIVLPRFSPDGTVVAGASANGWSTFADPIDGESLPLWDLRTGGLRILRGHTDLVSGVAFDPDGRRIITSSLDGTIRIWDSTSGATRRTLTLDGSAAGVDADADGWRVAVTHEDGHVELWHEVADGPIRSLAGHTAPVTSVAFSGDVLVTGCRVEGVARVFDLASGRERSLLRGHDAPLVQVALSPDGTLAATTGEDGTVKLWDAIRGTERLTFDGHHLGAHGVAFSPDGRLLASTSVDGTAALHLLPVDEFVGLARSRVTRGLTDVERRRYLRPTRPAPEA